MPLSLTPRWLVRGGFVNRGPSLRAHAWPQWKLGDFFKLNESGAQGRLAAVNKKKNSFDVESPDLAGPGGVSRKEVAVFELARLGPASDPELCAWWDGAVREACSRVRPPSAPLPIALRMPGLADARLTHEPCLPLRSGTPCRPWPSRRTPWPRCVAFRARPAAALPKYCMVF